MKTQINRGNYTEVEAKQAITQLYIKKMITEKEFNALMNLSDGLNSNTNIGEVQIEIVEIKEQIETIKTEIETIKQKLEESGTVVPEPEPTEQDAIHQKKPLTPMQECCIIKANITKTQQITAFMCVWTGQM